MMDQSSSGMPSGGASSCGACGCMHHKIVPLLVVVFGALFLLKAFDAVSMATVDLAWPILVILGGLMKWTKGMCKCC